MKFLAKERFKYVLKGNPLYCNDLDESVGVHGFFINNQYYNQRFHLEGNFLPKGNIGLWKDRNKEMQCGRKSEGNLVIWMESGRKFQNS